jgi:hypothetical protein
MGNRMRGNNERLTSREIEIDWEKNSTPEERSIVSGDIWDEKSIDWEIPLSKETPDPVDHGAGAEEMLEDTFYNENIA